jgi:hypothetical protein
VKHGRQAGYSDIEKEITSPQNPRLILHDSQGFVGDNFNIVKNFIKTRSEKVNLKDRLHAIWFDGPFGSLLYWAIDGVWSGCVPLCPPTAEVCSKLMRR